MTRVSTVLLMIWLAAGSAQAQTAQQLIADKRLSVRAYTEPEANVYLGQQTRLFVEVLTDSWFTTSPRTSELRIAGAIALEPERFSTNVTQRVGGKTLSGIRRGYLIYPQQAGDLEIPPLKVRFAVSVDGKPSSLITASTNSVILRVQLPPDGQARMPFVTSPDLRLEQNVERSRADLRVGDSVTRTLTVNASDTQALLLPVIDFAPVDGMSVYPSEPQLRNKADRGQYSGARIDSATYVLEEPGDFRLPEVSVNWWDPDARRFRTVSAEAVEFSVVANPAAVRQEVDALAESGPDAGELMRDFLQRFLANLPALIMLSAALVFLYSVIRRYYPAVLAGWRRRRQLWLSSEQYHFDQLERACRESGSQEVLLMLRRWAASAGIRPAELHAALSSASLDLQYRQEWIGLNAGLYSGQDSGQADARLSLGCVRQLRVHLLGGVKEGASIAASYATGLNPP